MFQPLAAQHAVLNKSSGDPLSVQPPPAETLRRSAMLAPFGVNLVIDHERGLVCRIEEPARRWRGHIAQRIDNRSYFDKDPVDKATPRNK